MAKKANKATAPRSGADQTTADDSASERGQIDKEWRESKGFDAEVVRMQEAALGLADPSRMVAYCELQRQRLLENPDDRYAAVGGIVAYHHAVAAMKSVGRAVPVPPASVLDADETAMIAALLHGRPLVGPLNVPRSDLVTAFDGIISELSGGKNGENRGQGDKEGDKKKKSIRPLNAEAIDCIRLYKAEKRKGETQSMKAVCQAYAAEHGGSFDSIYRTVKDHSTDWKGDKTGDNSVS